LAYALTNGTTVTVSPPLRGYKPERVPGVNCIYL
jgi:hypothetical protein